MQAETIKHYINDGFKKVCDVKMDQKKHWYYENIDKDLMFDDHSSWIYFIVLDDIVVKIGETGQPLGLKPQVIREHFAEVQPLKTTKCRLGRYRSGDLTDNYIRSTLAQHIKNKQKVSIWAKKCPVQTSQEKVCGQTVNLVNTIHKDLEQQYLKYFVEHTGSLPALNKSHI